MGSRAVVNIGVQQFDKVREQNAFYIDKTGFIKEWWEGGSDVTLITRPRRFGKTLNMSMVDCFFPTNTQAGETCSKGLRFGRKNSTGCFRAHIWFLQRVI